jgi:hypothetical protein
MWIRKNFLEIRIHRSAIPSYGSGSKRQINYGSIADLTWTVLRPLKKIFCPIWLILLLCNVSTGTCLLIYYYCYATTELGMGTSTYGIPVVLFLM